MYLNYGRDAKNTDRPVLVALVPVGDLDIICSAHPFFRPRGRRPAQVRIRSGIRSQGPRPPVYCTCTMGSFLDKSQGFPRGLNQQDVVSARPVGAVTTPHCSIGLPTQPGVGVGRVAADTPEESFPSRNPREIG